MVTGWLTKPCRLGAERSAVSLPGNACQLLATTQRNTYTDAARFRFSRNGRSDIIRMRCADHAVGAGNSPERSGTLARSALGRHRSRSCAVGTGPATPRLRIRSRVHRGVRHALFRGHASVTAGTFEVARDAAQASAFQAVSRSFPFPIIGPRRFDGRAVRIRPAAAAGRRGPHEVFPCPTRC
jgi:hypothetical protein